MENILNLEVKDMEIKEIIVIDPDNEHKEALENLGYEFVSTENGSTRYKVPAKTSHSLKILPEYFVAVASGRKTFEIRENDRNYQVGDMLILEEWDGKQYTGRAIEKEVVYILDDWSGYVLEGHVVMSIK